MWSVGGGNSGKIPAESGYYNCEGRNEMAVRNVFTQEQLDEARRKLENLPDLTPQRMEDATVAHKQWHKCATSFLSSVVLKSSLACLIFLSSFGIFSFALCLASAIIFFLNVA